VDTKNDVALIHLEKPLDLSDTVQPICLPTKEMRKLFFNQTQTGNEENESLYLLGWNRNVPDIMSLRLSVLPEEACMARWNKDDGTNIIPNGLGDRYCATVGKSKGKL